VYSTVASYDYEIRIRAQVHNLNINALGYLDMHHMDYSAWSPTFAILAAMITCCHLDS
jgi:hypothetical protein